MPKIANKGKPFKYERICKLDECNIIIKTNRKWKLFCCTEHQQEYWSRIRSGQFQLIKSITKLEEENRRIKEKLGMKS